MPGAGLELVFLEHGLRAGAGRSRRGRTFNLGNAYADIGNPFIYSRYARAWLSAICALLSGRSRLVTLSYNLEDSSAAWPPCVLDGRKGMTRLYSILNTHPASLKAAGLAFHNLAKFRKSYQRYRRNPLHSHS